MLNKIEHLGIAVRDLDAAEKIYTDLLGTPPYKREPVASEQVMTSFFQCGKSKIELLAATDPESTIAKYVEKRGEGLHHVAFAVDDIDSELQRLERLGYRKIVGPKDGADNKTIAFLHPKDTTGMLVELCQEKV